MNPCPFSTKTLGKWLSFVLPIFAASLYNSIVSADDALGSQIDDDDIDILHPIVDGRRDLFSGISISDSGEVVIHVHAGSESEAKSLLKQSLKDSRGNAGHQQAAEQSRSGSDKFNSATPSKVNRPRPPQHNIVLRQTRKSGADLDPVMDAITNAPEWEALRAAAIRWGIDLERNAVTVGVRTATDDFRNALNQKFGDAVELYETQEEIAVGTSRLSDWQPWAVGLDIVTDFTPQCSSAYIVERKDNYNVKGMITAAHCVRAVGDNVYNTFAPDGARTIGTVSLLEFTNNGHDAALITGTTYTPWTYTGDRFTTVGTNIKGQVLSTMGDTSLCTNGAFTGETCGTKVDAVGQCVSAMLRGVSKTICDASRLTSTTSAPIADYGDSGGPVIKWRSGGVSIAGHMSIATNPLDSGGFKSVWYVPVDKTLFTGDIHFIDWRLSLIP